jgi:hypothetical protein
MYWVQGGTNAMRYDNLYCSILSYFLGGKLQFQFRISHLYCALGSEMDQSLPNFQNRLAAPAYRESISKAHSPR